MPETKKTNKRKQNKGRAVPSSRNTVKATAKQSGILADARGVFTSYPYNRASLRLICEKTGINHNLIRYHFGSKEKLFEALLSQMISEMETGFAEFKSDMPDNILIDDFPHFITRFLGFGFSNPDGMKIIMQNIGAAGTETITTGARLFKTLTDSIQAFLTDNCTIKSSEKDVRLWVSGFSTAIVCLIGAEDSLLTVSGREDDKESVRRGVEAFLTATFSPSFDYLLSGQASKAFKDFSIIPTRPGVYDILRDKIPERHDNTPATKGDASRQRILAAARKVFSTLPYEAGTIRMIGSEGDMDFTLIRHYFASKEVLFNAVAQDLFSEFTREVLLVYEGLDKIPSTMKSHSLSSQRLIDHCFASSDALSILTQNAARIGGMGISLPGFDFIMQFITAMEKIIHELEVLKAPAHETRHLLFLKALILINSIGGASFYAGFYNMKPQSKEYHDRIYDLYSFLVYPLYSNLIVKYGTDEY